MSAFSKKGKPTEAEIVVPHKNICVIKTSNIHNALSSAWEYSCMQFDK